MSCMKEFFLTKAMKWNTYATFGYTYDIGGDTRSTGGVHHHQVRLGKNGWVGRTVQTNGKFVSIGKTVKLTETQGLSRFEEVQ